MNQFNIRPVEPKDVSVLRDIYAWYVENTHISFEYTAPSETEFRERIEASISEFPWIVCTYNATVIGYAYAHKHRLRDAYQWSPESSIYLAQDFHTKGIGRVLYNTLFRILSLQGYHTVFAGVALPNDKSIGIHQGLGFERIGIFRNVGYKNGGWHDTLWFQLCLQTIPGEPEIPVKLPVIKTHKKWDLIFDQANQQINNINKSTTPCQPGSSTH